MNLKPKSAVIFDLDGTLTERYLDFDRIRADIGLPPGPILEALETMNPIERREAEKILHRHELTAAQNVSLRPGARETLDVLKGEGFPVAIVTRNSAVCTDLILARFGLSVDGVQTRDDGVIKPSPVPVLTLCRQLGCRPAESWVVGDYLFDIQSGKEAGAKTILIVETPLPAYAGQADYVIRHLSEVLAIVLGRV